MTTNSLPEGWFSAEAVEQYDPNRYDFDWNDDFTAFRPLALTWWDDASYLDYQSRCGDEGYDPSEDRRDALVARLVRKGALEADALEAGKRLEAQGNDYIVGRRFRDNPEAALTNLNLGRAERGLPAVEWKRSDDFIPF